MIALHMENVRPLPTGPTVQDIFHLYAAVANTKAKLAAATAKIDILAAGGVPGLGMMSGGGAMAGMASIRGIGMGMEAGGMEEMAVETVYAAEVEAAERLP